MSPILETKRLVLREATIDDTDFIFRLVNDPDWLRHIGDRNVRTPADARRYIEDGPLSSYREHGFGLWVVALREHGAPIGLCGFLKRDSLDEMDLGYAFLPAYRKQGYARESCEGALDYARDTLGRESVLAIVSPENAVSIQLLERLGFGFEKPIGFGEEAKIAHLYRKALPAPT